MRRRLASIYESVEEVLFFYCRSRNLTLLSLLLSVRGRPSQPVLPEHRPKKRLLRRSY